MKALKYKSIQGQRVHSTVPVQGAEKKDRVGIVGMIHRTVPSGAVSSAGPGLRTVRFKEID